MSKKHKYYRKIVVGNKEYDWLYTEAGEDYGPSVYLFDIDYDYHKVKDIDIRKRRLNNIFTIGDYNIQITPKKVKELIVYGKLLSKQEQRKEKLKILNVQNTI